LNLYDFPFVVSKLKNNQYVAYSRIGDGSFVFETGKYNNKYRNYNKKFLNNKLEKIIINNKICLGISYNYFKNLNLNKSSIIADSNGYKVIYRFLGIDKKYVFSHQYYYGSNSESIERYVFKNNILIKMTFSNNSFFITPDYFLF
jgi:hypothetical protein